MSSGESAAPAGDTEALRHMTGDQEYRAAMALFDLSLALRAIEITDSPPPQEPLE